jgi:acetoin utilization deacetylase AcuC-like enzyme
MGFCLFNNIAITAAALSAAGERVLIADFDAHHGNGTEEIFYEDPSVLFVSWHQSPLYPGTGAITEIGSGEAVGTTVNVPLPAGTCGDAYLESIDRVVGGVIDSFEPTWLLISAGYDAHRLDPLTEMGLSSGDYSQITQTLMQAVPSGRTIAFLEGGYDLDALVMSTRATLGALIGESVHPERPTVGPDESFVIDRLAHVHDGLLP